MSDQTFSISVPNAIAIYPPSGGGQLRKEAMPKPELEKLLTAPEVAELLGVDEQLLADWRHRGVGPAYLKLGHRTVRYDPATVRKWLDGRQVTKPGDLP